MKESLFGTTIDGITYRGEVQATVLLVALMGAACAVVLAGLWLAQRYGRKS